jgi:hypothetical protein
VATNFKTELTACSAISGGFISQEIFKVLARKQVPFNNYFFHDAWTASGVIMKVSNE